MARIGRCTLLTNNGKNYLQLFCRTLKKSQTSCRRWGTPQIFFLLLHGLRKTWKIRILKKKIKKCRYHHFTHMYQKLQSYEVQFLRYGVRQNFFLSFWAIFCPFTLQPPTNPENQNFEKTKQASGDVILLNLCNKKYDHMMYTYSDMQCDR